MANKTTMILCAGVMLAISTPGLAEPGHGAGGLNPEQLSALRLTRSFSRVQGRRLRRLTPQQRAAVTLTGRILRGATGDPKVPTVLKRQFQSMRNELAKAVRAYRNNTHQTGRSITLAPDGRSAVFTNENGRPHYRSSLTSGRTFTEGRVDWLIPNCQNHPELSLSVRLDRARGTKQITVNADTDTLGVRTVGRQSGQVTLPATFK